MELTYREQDGYRLPNLLPPQEGEVTLGKYALLRRKYLMDYRPIPFTIMLTQGTLNKHLMEIDEQAYERMTLLIKQMKAKQGVTEALKESDQMAWVGAMNNIKNAAEEIVLQELIYI